MINITGTGVTVRNCVAQQMAVNGDRTIADKNGKPTRVCFRVDDGGNKVRFAKTTGDVI